MKIYKLLLILLFLTSFIFLGTNKIYAGRGCCSYHGGQSYCDYSTGRWVCVDGTYSPTCTCGGGYTPPPSCPLMSSYNSITDKCECYAGYVSNGTSCISNLQWCWNNYGYNSTYDYAKSGCTCAYGYTWNQSGTRCISKDESCHNQLGIMSRYNSLSNTCDCLSGYSIQYGMCQVKIETPPIIINKPKINEVTPTDTPIPTTIQKETNQPGNNIDKSLTPTIDVSQFAPKQPKNKSFITLIINKIANVLFGIVNIFTAN